MRIGIFFDILLIFFVIIVVTIIIIIIIIVIVIIKYFFIDINFIIDNNFILGFGVFKFRKLFNFLFSILFFFFPLALQGSKFF